MLTHKVEVIFKPEANREDLTEILTFSDELTARAFAAHKAAIENVQSARYMEVAKEENTAPTASVSPKYAPPHRRARLLNRVHGGRNG